MPSDTFNYTYMKEQVSKRSLEVNDLKLRILRLQISSALDK